MSSASGVVSPAGCHTTVSVIISGRSSTGVDVRRCDELRLELDVRRRRENITDVFDQEVHIQCDDALDDGALMKCATSGGTSNSPYGNWL